MNIIYTEASTEAHHQEHHVQVSSIIQLPTDEHTYN